MYLLDSDWFGFELIAEIRRKSGTNTGGSKGVFPEVKLPIAVVVFTYNRAHYLEETLKSLFKYLPKDQFAIIVSQDANMQGVTDKINEFKKEHASIIHIQVRIAAFNYRSVVF